MCSKVPYTLLTVVKWRQSYFCFLFTFITYIVATFVSLGQYMYIRHYGWINEIWLFLYLLLLTHNAIHYILNDTLKCIVLFEGPRYFSKKIVINIFCETLCYCINRLNVTYKYMTGTYIYSIFMGVSSQPFRQWNTYLSVVNRPRNTVVSVSSLSDWKELSSSYRGYYRSSHCKYRANFL